MQGSDFKMARAGKLAHRGKTQPTRAIGSGYGERPLRWGLSFALLVLAAAAPAGANDGEIDWSFGGGSGAVVLPLPPLADGTSFGRRARVQADGRIVVLADYKRDGDLLPTALLVYRLLPSGDLDPSFGSGGLVAIEPPPGAEGAAVFARGLGLYPDNHIVVGADRSGGYWWVTVVEPTGVLSYYDDFTFPGASDSTMADLAVAPSGDVIAVGRVTVADRTEAAFARWEGTLDVDFGILGRATFDLAPPGLGRESEATAVALDPTTGAIVFAGRAYSAEPPVAIHDQWLIGRLTPTGALDPGFAGVGYRRGNFDLLNSDARNQRLLSVAALSDGAYLAAGQYDRGPGLQSRGTLLRVLGDGSIDTNWGFLGFSAFVFEDTAVGSQVSRCAVDRVERLLCTGTTRLGVRDFVGVARFDGPFYDNLWRSGGNDYFTFPPIASAFSYGQDLALDPGGGVIFAGTVQFLGARAAVRRLFNGLPPELLFADSFE